MTKKRGWCFTCNNFTDEDEQIFNELECRYIIYGREIGASGTPHLQGYVEFQNPRGGRGLKRVHPRAHWEGRWGTPEEASEYCRKGPSVVERGELPRQGARTDLEEAASMVHSGQPLKKVADSFPAVYLKYHKGLAALKSMAYSHRTSPPDVTWIWGPTGTGKTRTAAEGSFYMKDGTPWWDGYEQQERIVIDDFDGRWPFRDLLRLLDRYPYQGQIKGGYVAINSPQIYITCEYHPNHYWEANELEQVKRRLTKIMTSDGTEVLEQK